jgi:hypothetical protein
MTENWKPRRSRGFCSLPSTERISDYVEDICELNVYLREAVFIKHTLSTMIAGTNLLEKQNGFSLLPRG